MGVLTAKQAPHWPDTALALGLRAEEAVVIRLQTAKETSMLFRTQFSDLSPRTPARRGLPWPARFRPRLEALDDDSVPSTLMVTNNLDTGVEGDGSHRSRGG